MCDGWFVNGVMASDSKSRWLLLPALLAVACAACSSGKQPPPKSAWNVLAPLFQRKDATNAPTVEEVIAVVLTPMRIVNGASHFYRAESRWPTNGQELGTFLQRRPLSPPAYAVGLEGMFIVNASDLELMKLLQFTPRTDGGLDVAWPKQGTNISHQTLRISAPTNSLPKPQP